LNYENFTGEYIVKHRNGKIKEIGRLIDKIILKKRKELKNLQTSALKNFVMYSAKIE